MSEAPQRPVPHVTPETQPYWDAANRGELSIPYCLTCKEHFFYPRQFCPRCFGWDIEWRTVSGRGRVYTYSIQYRPQAPGFQPPYVTAIVQLDEGPRLMTNLVGVEPDPANIQCDMPVEVEFLKLTDEISLPVFRPAGS